MQSVAEGIVTTQAASELASSLNIDAPIIAEVYRVLYEKKMVTEAVTDLLSRDSKPEFDF